MSKRKSIALRFRNRLDRLAPYQVLKALSEVGESQMPKVMKRLYALALDTDPKIALDAIEKIMKFSGVAEFVVLGLKVAADGAGEGDDPEEEDDRVARRKRLARKYAAPSASPGDAG